MRPKYFGLAGLVLTCGVISLLVWFEVCQRQAHPGSMGNDAVAPLADISVPGQAVLAQMDRLERNMPTLAAPPPQYRVQADLSAFGFTDVAPATGGLPTGSTGEKLSASHRLTLAFDGRVKRFCIIDNQLYTEGAALPDGASIVKIESRRVLIAKKSIQQWLSLDPLLQETLSQQNQVGPSSDKVSRIESRPGLRRSTGPVERQRTKS
jgi:hypothetical protein